MHKLSFGCFFLRNISIKSWPCEYLWKGWFFSVQMNGRIFWIMENRAAYRMENIHAPDFWKVGGLQIWFRKGVAAPGAFQIHTTCSIEGPRLNAHIRGGHVTISEGHTQTAIRVAWTQLHYFPYIKIHYASILKEKTACNCGVFPHGCRLA